MKTPLTAFVSAIALMAGLPATAQTTGAEAAQTRAETAQQTESERLNDFFEDTYNEAVARSPIRQTFLGIKTDYDKWDDNSPEAREAEFAIKSDKIEEMREEFDFDDLTPEAKLSYRLFEYDYEKDAAAFAYWQHAYVFDQMRGQQSSVPAFLINQHAVSSLSDAEAYIARLNGVEAYMDQHIANAEAASELGIRPPLFAFDRVISDARNITDGFPFGDAASDGSDDSPLMADFRKKVTALQTAGTVTEAEASDLMTKGTTAIETRVGAAYDKIIAFAEAEKAVATTDDGVWKLPDGEAYYAMRLAQMTTTDLTADEIHDLGLAEVARIHDEMRAIMKTVGFEGDLKDFFEFTRTDPQFYYENTDEGRDAYLADATALIDTMREALPTAFNTLPKADMIVKRVEPFREQSAGKAFYQRPAPDGSRPGIYYANLYNMADMPIYQMEALAYHEGLPGHHMQIAIAQELEGLPKFRTRGGHTAYTEGWGLYTEFLPKEMGFYQDPYSDFGRLAMELWRAARLVVDTGLHDKKWTREEAIDYLLENTPNPEGDAIKAIERYIVMPGQATAYKIGMIRIQELREDAKTRLGDKFTLGAFHDAVLRNGSVPLEILETLVDEWVEETLAEA